MRGHLLSTAWLAVPLAACVGGHVLETADGAPGQASTDASQDRSDARAGAVSDGSQDRSIDGQANGPDTSTVDSGGNGGLEASGASSDGSPSTADATADSGVADAPACEAGATLCGTTCTNTATDPDNCGSCSHACGSFAGTTGVCAASACQPIKIPIGGTAIAPLLVDTTALYFANGTGTTASSINLVSGAVATGGNFIGGLFSQDASNLYVVFSNTADTPPIPTLAGITKSTMSQYVLTQMSVSYATIYGVGVVGTEICAISYQAVPPDVVNNALQCGPLGSAFNATLDSCSLSSGSVGSCVDKGPGTLLSADADGVVWTEAPGNASDPPSGVLSSATASLSAATMLTAVPASAKPSVLALDPTYVYWYDSSGTGLLYRTTRAGPGTTSQLVTNTLAHAPVQLAVDSTYLYWCDSTANTISRVPISGAPSAPTVIATGQSSPTGIAVDTASVYWINSGAVVKLAKP
jgi:hypothetical protein